VKSPLVVEKRALKTSGAFSEAAPGLRRAGLTFAGG
jgi:hypothetical protein